MLTPAEKRLVEELSSWLQKHDNGRLLNIGAGRSVLMEDRLAKIGADFICDRIDVDDCVVQHPNVGECHICSVESMSPVASERYDLAFSNYVLEHVKDLESAASEIARVLKPGGRYITSIPNPTAPEFFVARHTPLQFHRLMRGGTGWHTEYSYKSVPNLLSIFDRSGLKAANVHAWAFSRQYGQKIPGFRHMATLYDRLVELTHSSRLKGNYLVVFVKS